MPRTKVSAFRRGGSYANKRKRDDEGDGPAGGQGTDPDAGALYKLELSSKRRLKVYTFKDLTLVDIREMYQNAAGIAMPTKKGISLTVDQIKVILEHGEEILAAAGAGAGGSAGGASSSSSKAKPGSHDEGDEHDEDEDEDEEGDEA